MPVTDEQIRKRLNELLETVDMETTSGKVAALRRTRPCNAPSNTNRMQGLYSLLLQNESSARCWRGSSRRT